MLEVRDLTVRYPGSDGDVAAVAGVDLTVADGETVCVLGPSGSGKSTLLRAVAGLERPAAGTVRWDGRDLAGVPPHQRGFGLMFQQHALFPHKDVAANVAFGLRMQGRSRAEVRRRTAEVLELVGLAGMGDRSVSTLSGGEQQRVALARSLAPEPRLLLLDEPLGALDRALRSRLVGELRTILDRGVTAVHVTHDHEEAFALGDRVVIMRSGRVVQQGPPAAVWRQPADAFVARFLGIANLLPAGASMLVLPPDSVRLAPAGAQAEAGPTLPGTVTARVFRGGAAGWVLTVATGAGPVEVAAPDPAPAPGAQVVVAVDPQRVALVPADGTGTAPA